MAVAAVVGTAGVAAIPAEAPAQVGCRISSMKMYSHYSVRERKHYMVFRPRITCTSQAYWKATYSIRRRRPGPDAVAAWDKKKGHGTRTFVLGHRCKNGNRFNGDLWVNVTNGGGYSMHAVHKNVEC